MSEPEYDFVITVIHMWSFLFRDTKMLALTGFHNWFKTSIHKWLQIVHEKSTDRIRKAVEMDQVSFIAL